MHQTDLRMPVGEWMDEEALLQLPPAQPANTMASATEIETPERQTVLEPLCKIAKTLWDPTLS
eukprot:1059016-Rhodomonas_salina.3